MNTLKASLTMNDDYALNVIVVFPSTFSRFLINKFLFKMKHSNKKLNTIFFAFLVVPKDGTTIKKKTIRMLFLVPIRMFLNFLCWFLNSRSAAQLENKFYNCNPFLIESFSNWDVALSLTLFLTNCFRETSCDF